MKKAGWNPLRCMLGTARNMDCEISKVKEEAGVIFFDAAGTLIHLKLPVGWHYAEIARKHGLKADEARMELAFRDAWRRRAWRPASPGGRDDDDRPWWRELALEVLRATVPCSSHLDEDVWFEELYWHFAKPGIWGLYEDAARCLDRLAERFRLAVISNFDQRLRVILQELGVGSRFERVFISSEIGYEKPDPGIFWHAMDVMNVKGEDCLHVGDDPERDWAGAAAAGIAVFEVRRPGVTLDDLMVCES
jgi:putative hydrolase of the HAD superfamily